MSYGDVVNGQVVTPVNEFNVRLKELLSLAGPIQTAIETLVRRRDLAQEQIDALQSQLAKLKLLADSECEVTK